MLPETQPEKRHCTNCGAVMTHVRLMWKKIDSRMPCHDCRKPDAEWK